MKETEKKDRDPLLFPATFTFQEKESKERERSTTTTTRARDDPDTVIDRRKFITFFNAEMDSQHACIPRIQTLGTTRWNALCARCREHGKAKLVEVVRKAARSTFLNGGGNRGWIANIDWLLAPSNFIKVVEGNYDNHFSTSRYTLDEARRAAARIIEQERHDELQASIQRRQQRAVSYEEYQQMLRDGRVKPPTE